MLWNVLDITWDKQDRKLTTANHCCWCTSLTVEGLLDLRITSLAILERPLAYNRQLTISTCWDKVCGGLLESSRIRLSEKILPGWKKTEYLPPGKKLCEPFPLRPWMHYQNHCCDLQSSWLVAFPQKQPSDEKPKGLNLTNLEGRHPLPMPEDPGMEGSKLVR